MLITDLNVETMANLAHNIELNRHLYPAGSEVRPSSASPVSGKFVFVRAPAEHDLAYQGTVGPSVKWNPRGRPFYFCSRQSWQNRTSIVSRTPLSTAGELS